MRFFLKKTKKITASILIALFVFNVFISSTYPTDVAAKQILTAFPSTFTSSWNNPAGVLSKELREEAKKDAFTENNAAYPALMPVAPQKKIEKKESPPENLPEAKSTPQENDTVNLQETTPAPEPAPADSPTPVENTQTPAEAAPSTPVSFYTKPLRNTINFLAALFSGPEHVLAENNETSTTTKDNTKKEQEEPILLPEKKETKNTEPSTEITTTTPPVEVIEISTTTVSEPVEVESSTSTEEMPITLPTEEVVAVKNATTDTDHTEQSFIEVANFSPEHAWKLGNTNAFRLKNPRLGLSLANHSIPGHEFVVYYKSEGVWHTLVTLKLNIPRSNEKNKGYFYFPLKKIKNINELSQMEIKIAHLGKTQLPTGSHAFVDAMWIETEYTDHSLQGNKKDQEPLLLISEKKDFNLAENLEFDFIYQKGKQKSRSIPQQIFAAVEQIMQPKNSASSTDPSFSVQTVIVDDTGAEISDIEPQISFAGEYDFTVNINKKPRKVKPGKYTLQVSLYTSEGLESYTQEFTWGVLAINSNKSMYSPGETAYLQMAALRDDGHTICDANLKLQITLPSGNTTAIPITRSEECGPNNVIDVPDYYSYFPITETGEHVMMLTNIDNDYSISDTFVSEENIPFSIERTGPTRIFPPADYPVTISITPSQHFNGTISEFVPEGFIISKVSISEKGLSPDTKIKYTTKNLGQETKISAEVTWQAGKTYILSYVFDAPDISPYLFTLGPARLESAPLPAVLLPSPTSTDSIFIDETTSYYNGTFAEKRQWQIASDAVSIIDPNGDGTTTCTPTPAGTHYTTVDEAIHSPSTPDVADLITCSENQNDFFQMGTISDISSATQVDVLAYYKNGNSNMRWEVELWNSAETLQYDTTKTLTVTTTDTWGTVSFTGLTLTQADLDGLKVKFKNIKISGDSASSQIYAHYASVTYTPANVAPTIGTIYVNSGSNINLTESTSTLIYVTSTVSDANGYSNIQSVTGKLFRSGVANGATCTNNNNNCYTQSSCTLANCSGNSCTATCSYLLTYFADPTSAGTPWFTEFWQGYMTVTDQQSLSASGLSSENAPDIDSLAAFDIATSTNINFGTLLYEFSTSTNYTDQKITVYPTGNTSISMSVYSSAVYTSISSFPGSYQKIGTSSTTSYESAAAMTTSSPGTPISPSLKKATSTPSNIEGYIWVGARAPYGVGSGTATSTIYLIAETNTNTSTW